MFIIIEFNNIDDLKDFISNEIIESKEVADILGCSRQYIDQLVKEQKIIPVKILNKNRLFYRPDILEFMKKRKK